MPYIKSERRAALYGDSNSDFNNNQESAGELNYMLTEEILDYLKYKGLSYQTINDIIGALDSCKEEFRRRIVNPYEDQKIKNNGDVYKPVLGLLKTGSKK